MRNASTIARPPVRSGIARWSVAGPAPSFVIFGEQAVRVRLFQQPHGLRRVLARVGDPDADPVVDLAGVQSRLKAGIRARSRKPPLLCHPPRQTANSGSPPAPSACRSAATGS